MAVTNTYEPIILIDIQTASVRRYATRNWVDASGNMYNARLIDSPELTEQLNDLWYGVENHSTVTLRIDNYDDVLTQTWGEYLASVELRGTQVLIQRVDLAVSTTKTFQARGKITTWDLTKEELVLTVECRDDEVLETPLPKGVVTVAAFDATALDVGQPINICFGNCKDVPLRNIQNDTTNNQYDYLIGYGTIEDLWEDSTHGVKRNGVLVNTAEYTFYDGSQANPYNGYAFIRFTIEQRDFGMQFYQLTADVKGLKISGATAERNHANIIEALLNNSTWGLSESVDAASFNTAETAFNNIGAYYCDGAITEQQKARDILNDLMFPFATLERASDGEWEITVDVKSSSVLTLGDNDGYWNNCEVVRRWCQPANESLKTLKVHYDLKRYADNEQPYQEISVTVRSTFGVDRIYELPFISASTAATRVASRLKQRDIYGTEGVEVNATMEASTLGAGEVFKLHCPHLNLSSQLYKIQTIQKNNVDRFNIVASEYSTAFYDNLAITVPATIPASTVAIYGPVADVGGWVSKSTHFSAVPNGRYSVSTTGMTSTGLQMTLPASSLCRVNDTVMWQDAKSYFGMNNFIIARNSAKIESTAHDMTCRNNNDNGVLRWTGSSKGWKLL